jgi:hypothetical protein
MVAVYILAVIVILFTSWHQLGHHKLITVSTYVFASIVVTCYQMFHPQALISCIVPTPVIVGTYLNMENPVFTKLQHKNNNNGKIDHQWSHQQYPFFPIFWNSSCNIQKIQKHEKHHNIQTAQETHM